MPYPATLRRYAVTATPTLRPRQPSIHQDRAPVFNTTLMNRQDAESDPWPIERPWRSGGARRLAFHRHALHGQTAWPAVIKHPAHDGRLSGPVALRPGNNEEWSWPVIISKVSGDSGAPPAIHSPASARPGHTRPPSARRSCSR